MLDKVRQCMQVYRMHRICGDSRCQALRAAMARPPF